MLYWATLWHGIQASPQWMVEPKGVTPNDFEGMFMSISAYENFPHARSVVHQISLLPATMNMPNTIHP